MKLRQSSFLLLAAAFLLVQSAICQQKTTSAPVCQLWYATVCGQETWNATQLPEELTLTATANQTTGHLITLPGTEPTIDIALRVTTNAGDLALAVLIDVQSFVEQNPKVDLVPVLTACGTPDQTACDNAIDALGNQLSDDQIKKAAIWWHGCVNSNDAVAKTFTGLQARSGYVLAVKANKKSSASVIADLTHHFNLPQQQTTEVCSKQQKGAMPPDGLYTNQAVGNISLAVSPQHGGTVAPARTFYIYSLSANGIFSVAPTGAVTFTGNVNYQYCPRMPAPQRGPVYPQ